MRIRESADFQIMEKIEKFGNPHLTNTPKYDIINIEREENTMTKRKKDKRERKMTPQQLEELTYMRKRGFVQKNGKAYSRKAKHKKGLDE